MTFVTTQPSGDPATQQTGQPQQQPTTPDQGPSGTDAGYTPEQIAEIVKRDAHAQQHITNLENENKGMREDLQNFSQRMQTFEDKLAAQQKVEELLKGNSTSTQQPTQTQQDTFDQSKLDEMVAQRVQQQFSEREQQANFDRAASKLTEVFKDKADEHVTKVAGENGLSFEEAQKLARTNPVMFENLFVKPHVQSSNPVVPTQGTQSTSTVPTQSTTTDSNYWTEMRRKNPTKFWDPATQRQYYQWKLNN